MSNSLLTGPWKVTQDTAWPWSYRIVCGDERTVLRYDLWTYSTSDTQQRANARPENAECAAVVRLIAAAPRTLAALIRLSEVFAASLHDHQDSATWQEAQAAIAEALEGRK